MSCYSNESTFMHAIDRAKNILLRPNTTWLTIEAEPNSRARVCRDYLWVVALIPAVCGFIGTVLVGSTSTLGLPVRVPLLSGFVAFVLTYVFALVGVFLFGLVINALARAFGGTRNASQAFKVAAYSSTGALVAGVFGVVPALAPLGLLGTAYSIYLVYTGLPVLMGSSRKKNAGYTAVATLYAFAIGAALIGTVSLITPNPTDSLTEPHFGPTSGIDASLYGAGIDAAAIAAATKNIEAGAKTLEQLRQKSAASSTASSSAKELPPPLSPAVFKSFMPERLADLPRVRLASNTIEVGAVPYTITEAEYASAGSDRTLTVEAMDAGAARALAKLTEAMEEPQEKAGASDDATSQQKGRAVRQRFDKDGNENEWSTTLANGIVVTLTATNLSASEMQAAWSALSIADLETIPRSSKP